jgi:hypothetical protein
VTAFSPSLCSLCLGEVLCLVCGGSKFISCLHISHKRCTTGVSISTPIKATRSSASKLLTTCSLHLFQKWTFCLVFHDVIFPTHFFQQFATVLVTF